MRLTIPALLTPMLILLPEAAGAKTIVQQLTALDPETRMEQRCNGRVSGIIRREHKEFNPDEVVAYAFADSTVNGSEVVAPGAAFRSQGNWYRVVPLPRYPGRPRNSELRL